MKNVAILDPQRLLKTLSILVLAFIPINMLFSPLFDFLAVEKREESWTVTISAGVFILTIIPLLIVAVSFLKSRNEKLLFRFISVFFIYAFIFTIYSSSDLFYPIVGMLSLLGSTLVGILFYVSARDSIISAKVVFYFLAFASVFAVLPLLLVHIDTERFAQLSEKFGANTILYGYENPRAVGWISTICLSLLTAYVSTQSKESRIRPIFLLLAIITSTTLFWSGSRGGLVAFAVSIAIVFSFSQTKNYKGTLSILFCIAVGGAISHLLYLPEASYGIFSRISQTLGAESFSAASSERTNIWHKVILYILERPFTGYGYLPHRSLDDLSHGSAHNIILDFWLGFGLIIGTIVMLFGIVSWVMVFVFFRKANDHYISALFCVVTTLLVYSMISGPYVRMFPLLLFAVPFGVILGVRSSKANGPSCCD
jgi:O-antigen ligase